MLPPTSASNLSQRARRQRICLDACVAVLAQAQLWLCIHLHFPGHEYALFGVPTMDSWRMVNLA